MYKISICTVCMNRLGHLRRTLPRNIRENLGYPNIEFVLLDYNSKDRLEDWVREELSEYIEAGILNYYRTEEPEHFYRSHSKNMALRLATGDILCMVDADNFAGESYAGWIQEVFDRHGERAIITTLEKDRVAYRDQGGKLCFDKSLLLSVRGFDEALIGYGMEDVDLVNRMEKSGGKRVYIEDEKYLEYIEHSNAYRLSNHDLTKKLDGLYIQLTSNKRVGNRVIYLMKDLTCIDVTYEYDPALKDNIIMSYAGWTMKEEFHLNALYQPVEGGLVLTYDSIPVTMQYKEADGSLLHYYEEEEEILLKRIPAGETLYDSLIIAYSECRNRSCYRANDGGTRIVNPEGWGRGTVYANFNRNNPVCI